MNDRFHLQAFAALMLAVAVVLGLQLWSNKRVQGWLAEQRPAWMDQAHREVLP